MKEKGEKVVSKILCL